MANISFTISSAPGITNDLIAVIYKTTAPAAEVDRIVKDAPHPDPYNFEFTDIASGTYIVKIHESPDGSTLGILRHDFWVDATIQKVLAYDIIDFIVDLGRGAPHYDPVDSATQYENPNLNGKTYVVFKPGFGALVWGTHIQTITGGGFEFINGQMFANGEEYTVLVSNLTYNNIQESAAGYPADVVLLTGNTSFGNSHYNKLLEVNGVGSVVTITIASIDTIPDGTKFGINTHNGTQRYVTLQLPVSKFCLINFVQYNAIYIGRGEEVTFIKKGAYLRIVHWDGDYRRVGKE